MMWVSNEIKGFTDLIGFPWQENQVIWSIFITIIFDRQPVSVQPLILSDKTYNPSVYPYNLSKRLPNK